MKRFATFLLALVMILSLAIPAFAADAEENRISIANAKPGETYALYKVFSAQVIENTEPVTYIYTVCADWADFFAEGAAGAEYVTIEDGVVTEISDVAALAKAAAAWRNKPDPEYPAFTASEGNTSVTYAWIGNGYYLVTSTLGTAAMTKTVGNATVTITEKNVESTIEKFVKEDSTGEWVEVNDAQVNDTVEFKSVVKIAKGARNVVVHDKMHGKDTTDPTGLTYVANSVAIAGLTKGTEYTVNESPADGDTFDIVFDQGWIDSLEFGDEGYLEFVITYSAVVNRFAAYAGITPEAHNTTYVSFGDASRSEEDTTVTKTLTFSIFKHAAGSDEHLAGATFQLLKDGEVVRLISYGPANQLRVADKNSDEWETALTQFTTIDADEFGSEEYADIYIHGVDSDSDYTLVEISAPEGYNKLKDPIEVTVNADNSTRVDVANQSGTELPSTGGVGTTMFYIFGGILVLAAVVLLVTKKRMAVAE